MHLPSFIFVVWCPILEDVLCFGSVNGSEVSWSEVDWLRENSRIRTSWPRVRWTYSSINENPECSRATGPKLPLGSSRLREMRAGKEMKHSQTQRVCWSQPHAVLHDVMWGVAASQWKDFKVLSPFLSHLETLSFAISCTLGLDKQRYANSPPLFRARC